MRALVFPVVFAVSAAITAIPAVAHAFCPTTSGDSPPDNYDETVSGCWKSGVPIGWPANVGIDVHLDPRASKKVPLDVAARIVKESFDKWMAVDCNDPSALATSPSHPYFDVQVQEPRTVDVSDCGADAACAAEEYGTERLVIFHDDHWPEPNGSNTYALTTVTYGRTTGRILGATIEVNTADHDFVETGKAPGTGAALDYMFTHETGHFLGLAHSDKPDSIMHALYRNDGNASLRADDRAAICATRAAPDPVTHSSCGCGVAGSSSGGWAGLFVVLALLLRPR